MKAKSSILGTIGVLVILTSACASGGPPSNADGLYEAYSGTWILDVSTSTDQIDNPMNDVADNAYDDPGGRAAGGTLRQERWLRQRRGPTPNVPALRATFEVLRERPERLILRVDPTTFAYQPAPGEAVRLPMDGSEVRRTEGEHPVDAKLEWDGAFAVIEYRVARGSFVKERFEVVGDRLIIQRTIGSDPDALLLAYDRAGR